MNAFNSSAPEEGRTRELQLFDISGSDIRFGETSDGVAYAIASDFAKAMGHRDAANALRLLDDGEKGTQIVSTPGGNQAVSVIYEDGLWELIFRSTLPGAKAIKSRVKEILREIRRTGAYAPKSELEIAREYLAAVEAKVALQQQIAVMAPQADKWDRSMKAEGLTGMTTISDLLGIPVRDFTNWLVEIGVFRKQTSHGELHFKKPRNLPRLDHQRSGCFVIREEEKNFVSYPVVYATPKGVDFVMNLWNQKG